MELAIELPISGRDLAVDAQVFVAKKRGKYRVMFGEEVGGNGEVVEPIV